jgi:sigma-B regulation protein RsbU (phosphoserine phosphatase)
MTTSDRKLILVVDDTPSNIAVISGVLKEQYRTKIATTAEKAFSLATGADRPALILLDVMMPGMDGFEICERLKANPETREIPVIFLTAATDDIDEVRGFEVGAADYIHKPISASIVLARVKTQLATQAALTRAREGALQQAFPFSEVLETALASLHPIELDSNEVLINQGDASDAAYYLDRGSLLVYAETSYGPVSLATIEAPRFIGEIGALTGLARTTSVKALGPARVFRIARAQLFELTQESPELLMSVVGQLGQQIDSVNKAVALYTNALSALGRREFNPTILDDLVNPSPALAEFATAFRHFAEEILSKRRQQAEMESAALIQQSFLPKDPKLTLTNPALEIHAKIRPAREVGGDFYDFFMLGSDRLAIVIGDVCGKGVPASLFMAVVVTVLRLVAREEPNALLTMSRTNKILCRDNLAQLFATVFYAVLDLRTGTLEFCNCGQNAPVYMPQSGPLQRLAATGMPIALFDDRPPGASSIKLNPGDTIFLFTDGVTEALNSSKKEFGDHSLLQTLMEFRNLPAAGLVSRLFTTVDDFAEGEPQADDITCVAIRFTSGSSDAQTNVPGGVP